MPGFRKRMAKRVPHDEWLYPNINTGCVLKFDESGKVLETLWDLGGENHPMITSMREHNGYLYLGGILNNRIGQCKLPGADPNVVQYERHWGKRMIAALKQWTERVLGRGDAAVTVPALDGALRPNRLLEDAEVVAELDAPDDLASDGASLLVADGARVLRVDAAGASAVAHTFERTVSALACLPGGGIAVALGGQRGARGRRRARRPSLRHRRRGGDCMRSPRSPAQRPAALLVSDGSRRNRPSAGSAT